LEDATIGHRAMLQAAITNGDIIPADLPLIAVPDDPITPVVWTAIAFPIYNDVDDEGVCRMQSDAASYPCLLVVADNVAKWGWERMRRQAEITMSCTIAFMVESTNENTARKQSGYVTGAIMDSLWCFNEPGIARTLRTYGSLSLVELDDVDEVRVGAGVKDQLAGAVVTRGRYRRPFQGRVPS
jgi:hypothetical protein